MTTWTDPPLPLELASDTVHIWRIPLDQPDGIVVRLKEWLSTDERERAERFRFPRDRDRFIVGRAALRGILALGLRTEPREVRIAYGPQGKPSLDHVSRHNALRFNLAHSQALGVLALALGREVGIDVELVRPLNNADQIAERFFSRHEVERYAQIADADRPEAFFRCWTRKEAYLKALGTGLSMPLDRFDVSLLPDDPRLLQVADRPDEVARWAMRELRPLDGYLATVIAEGSDWSLRCYRWDGASALNNPAHS